MWFTEQDGQSNLRWVPAASIHSTATQSRLHTAERRCAFQICGTLSLRQGRGVVARLTTARC